jgi:hypothetical protein
MSATAGYVTATSSPATSPVRGRHRFSTRRPDTTAATKASSPATGVASGLKNLPAPGLNNPHIAHLPYLPAPTPRGSPYTASLRRYRRASARCLGSTPARSALVRATLSAR